MSNLTFSPRASTRRLESGDSVGSGEMTQGRGGSNRSSSNSMRKLQMDLSRGNTTDLSIFLTNKKLDDGTSYYGATALHLHSCTKPIQVRQTLSFSGTLVRLELDELILPHNLMVLLLTGCFLQEITFGFVCLREPFPPRDGKIIAPSVKSVTIIGDSSASALTKHEVKVVSFLANWVIFRKLRSISIFGQSNNVPGRVRCGSMCAIKDSSLKKGREALGRLFLDNAETLNEMKSKLTSDKSVEEAFEDMNRGVDSVHELRNRLFEFIKFMPGGEDDGEKLAKLQFSVLKVLTSSITVKNKVLWDVLGNQKVLSTFVYLEQAADGKDHLEDVLGVVKACAGTLQQLSIVVGDVKKRVKDPAEFSMKPLVECKILRKLTLMMNKTKRIMHADLLPKRVESLKIMGVMGPNEIGNLFNGIQQTTSATNLVSLQFFNILRGRDGSHVSKAEHLYYQQGNLITAEMVLHLFQQSQLKKVLLCDRRLPTAKIKAAFCHLYGVSVKEFEGRHGKGITIYARISDAFSEFSLHDDR